MSECSNARPYCRGYVNRLLEMLEDLVAYYDSDGTASTVPTWGGDDVLRRWKELRKAIGRE